MINEDMRKKIRDAAASAFEQIASDYFEGPGSESNYEDAVEPTMWQMSCSDLPSDVRNVVDDFVVVKDHRHPDHEEAVKIIRESIKRYF